MQIRTFDVLGLLIIAITCGSCLRSNPVVDKPKPALPSNEGEWTACLDAFADAEESFRSLAPGLYEPYRTLSWEKDAEAEDRLAPTEVRAFSIIAPGRSWYFMAAASEKTVLLETSVPRMDFEPRFIAQWQEQENEEGYALARARGGRAAVVWIDTDRPGQFDVADHPLSKAFLSEFKAAADTCLEHGN